MDLNRFDTITRSLSQTPSRRNALRLLAGSTIGGLLTVSAVRTGAKNGGHGKGKGKKGRKVTICHQGKTITVSKSAQKAHIARGATVGRCPSGPTCSDGITNGSETDVDCGGTCPRCATGKTCASSNDCASARCDAGSCKTCVNSITDCGTDTDGTQCACRDHESGQRFCTKSAGRFFPAKTPCAVCQGSEQCFLINGGAGGIECILPCGAPIV